MSKGTFSQVAAHFYRLRLSNIHFACMSKHSGLITDGVFLIVLVFLLGDSPSFTFSFVTRKAIAHNSKSVKEQYECNNVL